MTTHLIIGLGEIGLPVANQLANNGLSVIGMSLSTKPNLHKNIHHIQSDARKLTINQFSQKQLYAISHITLIVTPKSYDEQGYHDSYYTISQAIIHFSQYLPNLKRVVFISSTGIYGQNSGETIDIHSEIITPKRIGSQIILASEQLLQQHFTNKCTIIRPSGIYGEKRLQLINIVKNLTKNPEKIPENTWTNRIMDSDLINIIQYILRENQPLPLYIATDNQPSTLYDVLNGLAKNLQLSIHLPDTPALTGKKILNNLPDEWLIYKNWQQGYSKVLATFNDN